MTQRGSFSASQSLLEEASIEERTKELDKGVHRRRHPWMEYSRDGLQSTFPDHKFLFSLKLFILHVIIP